MNDIVNFHVPFHDDGLVFGARRSLNVIPYIVPSAHWFAVWKDTSQEIFEHKNIATFGCLHKAATMCLVWNARQFKYIQQPQQIGWGIILAAFCQRLVDCARDETGNHSDEWPTERIHLLQNH